MSLILFILVALVFVIAIAAPIIYVYSRRRMREQKSYERGLKMVPLLIRLPPSSDDTEIGARDVRDVTEEVISKAQIAYGILAAIFEKSFKQNFYGQRHISFEVVGHGGFIHFYAMVPIKLVEHVKQAVISAYPSAILEEAPEPNIFSPVGKMTGTLGGELTLKENFAYPLASYEEIKRDPMKSILNAMSNMDKEDGAAIQILIRPAKESWRKQASDLASNKRSGKTKKSGSGQFMYWIGQVFEALFKPPEHKEGEAKDSDLSSHEQSILNAIDEKTKYPGFETAIRIVCSSNIASKAEGTLRNIVASFELFNAPSRNGFQYKPAHDLEGLTTAYMMRFFPPEHNNDILSSVELASLFHFPQREDIPTSQLTRQDSKQVDAPRDMPEKGILLGYNVFRGDRKRIFLDKSDRRRHSYIVGQTGVGKSVLLENLAIQDMLAGNGFAFIDPHGDAVEGLLERVPKERTEDVIYFNPSDFNYPLGLNVFEAKTDDQKDFVIQEVINVLYKLYDPNRQGMMGARFEDMFRMSALLIMSGPNPGAFIDIPKLFRDPAYVRQKLKYCKDDNVIEFWTKQMPQNRQSKEFGDLIAWFTSKFGAFLANTMMRNIIGQTESAFSIRDIMDNRKILLVNLSKGKMGELNSNLMGMVLVMKFQAAAMSRANIPDSERKDFYLYVDEFQNFSTDSFATILSEARKYKLNLIVANQFTTQLTEEVRDAVFGNVGTIVSFRVGQDDVDTLTKYFHPVFNQDDLLRIPNYNTIIRTMVGGVPTQPFSMTTLPPLGKPNKQLGDALKQLSAAKYGRPRQAVEKGIFDRLKTMQPPPSALPSDKPPVPAAARQPAERFQQPPSPPAPARRPVNPNASFLDQWMAKRKSSQPGTFTRPAKPMAQTAQSAPVQPTTASAGTNIKETTDKHHARQSYVPPSMSSQQNHDKKQTSQGIEKSDQPKPKAAHHKKKPKAGEIKLRGKKQITNDNLEDTIEIDKEGNIHSKSP